MSVTAPEGLRRVAASTPASARTSAATSRSSARSSPPSAPRMFTANRVQAAPVLVCKEHLELAQPQAVVVNSGVANAATGEQGMLDARATAAEAARLLGLEPEQVLVLSTGVIGAPLPIDKLLAGVRERRAAALARTAARRRPRRS